MTSDSADMLRFLPVGLNIKDKKCMVVGGGGIGTRKVLTLTRAGATVTVVSPIVTEELSHEIEAGGIRWVKESFREEHLGGAFLVVAATDDEVLNASVVRAAVKSGALVCDASSADRSQVIFGALLESDDATVAVFTGGRDPAQARRTRDRIAKLIAQDSKSKPHP
ncbi:MAG: precorrin-2 dehydrogenase/sirohydrochlorin ferrochelatase family protein [Planctomycetota bacterium]|jgi:precorrin-2 dehydrogenase/sirohydrochlorin ferrochelatase